MWYECVIPMIVINCIIILGMIRYPLTKIELYLFLLNILLAGSLLWITLIVYRTRKNFFIKRK